VEKTLKIPFIGFELCNPIVAVFGHLDFLLLPTCKFVHIGQLLPILHPTLHSAKLLGTITAPLPCYESTLLASTYEREYGVFVFLSPTYRWSTGIRKNAQTPTMI
jgi:hypothetical protein